MSELDSSGYEKLLSKTSSDREYRQEQSKAEEFSLKKIPQAAKVGALGVASDTVLGAGVQLQDTQNQADSLRLDNWYSTDDQNSDGARRARLRQMLQSGESLSLSPDRFHASRNNKPESQISAEPIDLSKVKPYEPEQSQGNDRVVRLSKEDLKRESFVRTPLTESQAKILQGELSDKEILPVAAKLSEGINQMIHDVGYVPSSGFIPSVVEGAVQSTPHFAGGIATSVAGGVFAGPPGALAAGAAYFGATEGLTHTGDTYRRLISEGMGHEEALSRASTSGRNYAAISGVLEFAGLGAITKGTRFGKTLDNLADTPQWQQASVGVLRAGGGEGTTEVLQGLVGESLQAYAAENWDEFKEKYTQSTEPAQEFASAFILGGGVRGGYEVVNPENYSSFAEWRRASGVSEPVAAEIGLDQSEQAEAVEVDVIPAEDAMIHTDGTVTRISESQQTETDIDRQVGQFFSANGTSGSVIDAETEQQHKIQREAAERGVRVLYVRGEGRLGRPAASPSQGVILIDADLSPGRQTDAIAWHEMVHEVEHRNPGAWAELHNDLSELAPELMSKARERYQAGWKRETGEDIPGEILDREGPSVAAEMAIDFILAEDQTPGTLGAILAKKPGLKERVIDLFAAMLRRVGLNVGVEKLEQARNMKEHVNAAVLIRDAVRSLKAHSPSTPTEPVLNAQSVANADQSSVIDGNEGEYQPVIPRGRMGAEFSNRDIRRRLKRNAIESGFEDLSGGGAVEQAELENQEALVGHEVDFSFAGPLPTEIKEALSGKHRGVRSVFKAHREGGTGSDTLNAIGADAMVDLARRMVETGDAGLDRHLDMVGDSVGDTGMLRVLESLREGKYSSELASIEVIDNPGRLEDGSTFEIEGHEFVVYTNEIGAKYASDGVREFPIDIESMPITEGSLRRDVGAEVAEAELDIPFALRDEKIQRGEPLTEYDTPEIIKARKESVSIPQTYKIDTPKRKRLRKRIARQLYGKGAARKDRVAVLVIGTPGAGKSSAVAEPLIDSIGGMIIDSDDAKKKLPEFGGGIGAMATHVESTMIADLVTEKAVDAGDNLIIPRVGSSAESLNVVETTLRSADYEIHIVHLHLSVEKTIGRVIKRFKEEGRFVDPDYVVNSVGTNPDRVYNELKEGGLHASYSQYSSDVSRGELPVAIESIGPSPKIPSQGTPKRGRLRRDYGQERRTRSSETQRDARAPESEGRDQGLSFALRDGQENLPGAGVVESFITEGRPDLANPGNTQSNRQFVNTVDELRNVAGHPARKTDEEVEARADELMKLGKGIEDKIRSKVDRGEILDDVETIVAQRLVNQRAADAIRKGDKNAYREALINTDAYRQSGTLAARAFRQRRDKQKGPKERYREALMGAFLEPDPIVREKLHKIREQLMDPDLSDSKRKRVQRRQENLFDREAERITKIKKDLEREGLDPRIITEESMLDPMLASKVVDIAQRSRGSKVDALYWVWMNSILSGPLTHMANLVGNAANLAYRFAGLKGVEGLAGSFASKFGADPDFTVGDWIHMWKSVGPALSAGFTNMARSYATNRQVFDEQITGEPLPINQIKGEKVQVLSTGPRNKLLRAAGLGGLPLKMLMVEDQFFKTVAGVMEAHALAHRQAVREGLTGEARNARIDELLAPKPELFGESLDTDIWRQSLEEAKVAVFQDEPSVIGKTALELRQGALGPVLKWIIPFITTPDRLFVRGIEASPLGLVPLLPRMTESVSVGLTGKSVIPSKLLSESGGAGDVARGFVALGLLAALFSLKDDEDGFPRITGSRSPSWKDLPEQYRTAPPLSVRIGGKWYSYARIEPISTGIALTIDLFDRVDHGDDIVEALSGSGETLIALTQDKTFIRSIGQIMEAFSNPDRASEVLTDQARKTLVTAWVPNLFKQSIRAANPEIVDTKPASDSGFWTKQAAKIPYEAVPLRKMAPAPKYDIWGRPVERNDPFDGGTLGFLWRLGVPINVSDADLHPMDRLIWNYNEKVARGEIDKALDVDGADSEGEIHARPPARYFTRNGVRINMTPEEYQELIRSVGEAASKRLLAMDLNIDDPGPRDVQAIKRVFKREYARGRTRVYQERQLSE